jgi:hypothetical protein
MFDFWKDSTDYRTLFRLDRQVRVDTARLFPATGIRKDELPGYVNLKWPQGDGLKWPHVISS